MSHTMGALRRRWALFHITSEYNSSLDIGLGQNLDTKILSEPHVKTMLDETGDIAT